MMINLEQPRNPRAQAFFQHFGWSYDLLIEGGELLLAAGRYGIYQFSLDDFNLRARGN